MRRPSHLVPTCGLELLSKSHIPIGIEADKKSTEANKGVQKQTTKHITKQLVLLI